MKRIRMQYFYADVPLRGEYPGFMLRYFKENDIHVDITEADKALLKENTLDFLAFSYYYSRTLDSQKNTMDPASISENPYLKANAWGWTIDPLGHVQRDQSVLGPVSEADYDCGERLRL